MQGPNIMTALNEELLTLAVPAEPAAVRGVLPREHRVRLRGRPFGLSRLDLPDYQYNTGFCFMSF